MTDNGHKIPLADASWLQAKVAAQGKALDALHSTIVRQRFVLRMLEQLGRGLTREEFLKFRAAESEPAQKRIGNPA